MGRRKGINVFNIVLIMLDLLSAAGVISDRTNDTDLFDVKMF